MTIQELETYLGRRGFERTHEGRGSFFFTVGERRVRVWAFPTATAISFRVSIGPARQLPMSCALALNGRLLGGALCLDDDWYDVRVVLPIDLADAARLDRTLELLGKDALRAARELRPAPAALALFDWLA
jgi:hypothetical protein